ncbi:acyl carrier protein [Candidatus Bathyarchaeota archaeon]|nr:MAG: acyl carrier protein [Candidatus Bathyarchaeota archaeon]
MASNEKTLKEILAKVLILEENDVNDAVSRENTESWDSLAHLMLITEVESAFGVTFSDEDIIEIKTVGDLKSKLRKLGVKL